MKPFIAIVVCLLATAAVAAQPPRPNDPTVATPLKTVPAAPVSPLADVVAPQPVVAPEAAVAVVNIPVAPKTTCAGGVCSVGCPPDHTIGGCHRPLIQQAACNTRKTLQNLRPKNQPFRRLFQRVTCRRCR